MEMTFIKTKYAINESGYFVSDLTFYQNKVISKILRVQIQKKSKIK